MLLQVLLPGVPAIHTQRRAGREGLGKRLDTIVPEEDWPTGDVEEYTKARDVVNHAFDRNEVAGDLI